MVLLRFEMEIGILERSSEIETRDDCRSITRYDGVTYEYVEKRYDDIIFVCFPLSSTSISSQYGKFHRGLDIYMEY